MRSDFKVLVGIALLAGLAMSARAVSYSFNNNNNIPDGDLSGLADTRTIVSPVTSIGSLKVTLSISDWDTDGAFNGDLYVTLIHNSGYVVLLNRPGRSSTSPFGYSDDGLSEVVFDDAAMNGDVHSYRLTLMPSGALTGVWQPDGRTADPDSVLLTDPRTTSLASFKGLDANGSWTIFCADLSSGSQHRLDSWGLEITAVPEGMGPWKNVPLLALIAWNEWHRRRRA